MEPKNSLSAVKCCRKQSWSFFFLGIFQKKKKSKYKKNVNQEDRMCRSDTFAAPDRASLCNMKLLWSLKLIRSIFV